MKLCVHNHEGPMRYNAKEWRGVQHNTDPALVSMCLDLDWTWQAGTDPFPLLYEAGTGAVWERSTCARSTTRSPTRPWRTAATLTSIRSPAT